MNGKKMNILMMTNTYLPFVGGVERSVETFSKEYRKLGHNVKVVATRYEGFKEDDEDIIRVPALQHFNGTDFSVQLPVPGVLNSLFKYFTPHIIHSHHPFMLGDSALRLAAQFKIPIVFTFHTYYEHYTHYIPGDSAAMKRFVAALATGYANLCDCVIAPSKSVAKEIIKRGVITPVEAIPTGICLSDFAEGNGKKFRKEHNIPSGAFVVGFISRLAPEKNLKFLAESVKEFLIRNKKAHFLLVGSGPCEKDIKDCFNENTLSARFHHIGTVTGKNLVDAYHAMDVFAFTSFSETQGLVLTEAMASGVPVVALDSPVVSEIVSNLYNGIIVKKQRHDSFCDALSIMYHSSTIKKAQFKEAAFMTAKTYEKQLCVKKVLTIYSELLKKRYVKRDRTDSMWEKAMRMIKAELELIYNMTKATGAAMNDKKDSKPFDNPS
ncbi:glycosyltransferase [Chitinispirillales bacterium ANBcel5]|uniref:glycosyltransferase n=1 Tax=Cellulosispirillum alkaliphilum TaxID=3039283 RepID=UPI002A55CA25|nr:glycosyltransferase [Chitinispirillales bacterium ANBcel5]